MTEQDIIDKYFGEKKVIYPIVSDSQKYISGELFVEYVNKDGLEIWVGNDDGYILLCKVKYGSLEKIDRILNAIIY